MAKFMLWVCIGIGGTAGSLLPMLWHSDGLFMPVLLSTLGSLFGIYVWFKLFRFS